MDLYRVLRVSVYLLVASGAFAISVAEESSTFLLAVFLFGALAYVTVDSRRIKPVRMEFAAPMALALLVYTLLPLRESDGLERHFPAAFAHFLCAIQVLLFFTVFRGPLLLVFGGSTLAVIVISGIMKADITLLVRLIFFVSITSWTLFIHALWCAREAFNAARVASIAAARSAAAPQTIEKEISSHETQPSLGAPVTAPPVKEAVHELEAPLAINDNRLLSERAFWQELAMTAVVSIACLLLGIFLFVAAPRLNDSIEGLVAWARTGKPKNQGSAVVDRGGTTGSRTACEKETGLGLGVKIGELGPIHANNTPALNVKFESLPPQFATDNGRVLLRGQTFSTYNTQSFEWVPPEHLRTNDPTTDMSDPSVPDAAKPTPVRPVIKQTTESLGDIHSRIYLAAGTIKRVSAKVVDQDEEGSLHPTPGEPLDRTELFTQAPVHARDLPPTVWAQHPKADRYVRQRCVVDDVAERIREKAHQVTNGCATALEKVQAIQKYLRDSKNFSYTLNLQELNAARDPMERFLLSDDARQRRGHCGYFATAFVTLCRFNDIPARLASGYSADYPRDAVEPVEIRFLKASAHCWGEVYFKGYGWVPFDPTPSASQEIASAPLPVLPTEVQPAAPMPKPAVPTEGVVESTWKTFIGFTGIEQRKYYTKIGEFVSGRATDATEVLSGGSSTGWIGGTIAWLAITGMVAWLIHAYRKRGGSRLPPGGYGGRRARAAVAFYNDLLQVLSRRGFVRRPGQTPREFAEYVVKRGGNAFSPVMTVTHIFETVRYGGDEINQEDFNSLQKSLDSLRELTFVLAPQGPKQ